MGERFKDKVVVVTGATGELGPAIDDAFLAEGASVALADADAVALDETVHRLHDAAPRRVIPVQTDVTSEVSVQGMVRAVLDVYKRFDVLVCNADAAAAGDATELDAGDWRRVIEANLTGTFLCAKHAARAMKERGGGTIVLVDSACSGVDGPANAACAASRSGTIGLARSLALELGPHNIRVNAVCAQEGAPSTSQTPSSAHEHAEVVAAVLFLAGADASYITGQALTVGAERG